MMPELMQLMRKKFNHSAEKLATERIADFCKIMIMARVLTDENFNQQTYHGSPEHFSPKR